MLNQRITIAERAARYLTVLPPSVTGRRGHNAAFAAAHGVANGFALDEDVSVALLLNHFNPRCLPHWTEAELRHKVRSALNHPGVRGRGYLLNLGEALPSVTIPLREEWPAPDPSRIEAIVKDGPTAAELTLLSPGPLDDEDSGQNTPSIVEDLFADAATPDPLLCIGKSSRVFATRPLSAWLASGRLAEFSFVVPARMTATTGKTKAGKTSEHTLDNTGPRRFVVVEFDTGTTDEHAARLWHLDGYAPLALVVHSGGKSLHGWFPVAGYQPADVQRFMRHAASIGADVALFRNPSQFVRMPGGTRDCGCRQSMFYYAPNTLAQQGTPNAGEDQSHE